MMAAHVTSPPSPGALRTSDKYIGYVLQPEGSSKRGNVYRTGEVRVQ